MKNTLGPLKTMLLTFLNLLSIVTTTGSLLQVFVLLYLLLCILFAGIFSDSKLN